MANVTLTAALRANLLSLQGTASLLDQTQLRLASGRKVNSALDNPTAFFAAQSLTNRAGDLGNLLDGMGQAIQVLTAADSGISNLTKMVQQAQSIAQTAQNGLSSSGAARSGDMTAAQAANITTIGGFAANNTVALSAGATVVGTVTITANMTLAQLAAAINSISGVSAQVVDGSSGTSAGSKRLEIRATNGAALTMTNGFGTFMTAFQANSYGAGGVVGSRLDTGLPTASGAQIAATTNTVDQVSLESQYRTVRSQIDALITDAGYQGTNLLNGDTLKVQFNERNTSKLTVVGTTLNSTALGISYTEASTFLNSTNITASLNEITSALTTLRSQAQAYGNNLTIVQTRQDFTKNLINTLKAGSDLLTLADKNEEGANLLSLQTSQQLGIQALSLASQANQSVLRLFG